MPRKVLPPIRRLNEIRSRLLHWYQASRRLLPWREHPEPYRVWVAEVMLQQTLVATVIPYYERFLARFPDVACLAAAAEDQVLALWSGLGYYSRARHLHGSARIVMETHGGRLPDERVSLEALPGIGRYTAGAILSIAFGKEEPIVDGNVRRFLSRLLLPLAAPHPPPSPEQIEEAARALVHGAPPADLNQALMEIGALVCRPATPRCDSCPLASQCGACRLGAQARVPAARPRRRVERLARAVAVIRDQGRILLERGRGPAAPRGLWDLPGAVVPPGANPLSCLKRELGKRRLSVRLGIPLASVDHTLTYRRIHTTAYEGRLGEPRFETLRPGTRQVETRWVEAGRTAEMPLGAAARRLLQAVSYLFSG